MITLYKPNETDFTHNGIGILDHNIYEAEVEEILNGVYTLRFKYPLFAPHGLEIDGQYLIKAPTPDGDQLFRVANPHPTNGEVQVFCYHIFYDLVDNFIEDTNIVSKSGTGALEQIKSNLQYATRFEFFSDITKVNHARVVRKNPVEVLLDSGQDHSFLNRWGGELKRDNFNVRMLTARGLDRGVVIQHKKDLLGYEASVDWQSVITKIMPQGADELLLPEKYVTSPLVNKYVNPKIRKVEFPAVKAKQGNNANDEEALPLPQALDTLRAEAKAMFDVQHVDQPLATYNIKFQELSQTEEYKDFAVMQRVYMGDTVTVQHLDEGIDVKAKVVSYKYDPLNQEYTDITIGNYKDSFADVGNKIDRIKGDIEGMESSMLDKAKQTATDLINSGFGGHVRMYPDRILIMDTKDEATAEKVWQWNMNGLGYSKTGMNGPYGLAMTMDGSIVADYITTGLLSASLIRAGVAKGNHITIDFDAGSVSFQKGTIRNSAGTFEIHVEAGSIKSHSDKGGFDLKNGIMTLFGNTGAEYGKIQYDWTNGGASLLGKNRWNVSSYHANFGFGTRKNVGTGMYGTDAFSYLFGQDQLLISAGDTYSLDGMTFVPRIYFFNDRIDLFGKHINVNADFRVIGAKNAVHVSRNGVVATPAYETAESYLGDIGTATTNEECECIVDIDCIFTDIANTRIEYQVFVSSYCDANIWVSERNETYFVVKSSKPVSKFAWEIKAKRIGYENDRLNVQEDMDNNEIKRLYCPAIAETLYPHNECLNENTRGMNKQ
ncbi:phage tail protein [Bacillus cereus]|nr:phage tail protein [Bacillus cereus]